VSSMECMVPQPLGVGGNQSYLELWTITSDPRYKTPTLLLYNFLVVFYLNMSHQLSTIDIDEGLVPDLPRGRGRLIGGDLDIGEEGSKQTIVILQSLCHGSISYQHTRT
jgi:hypothetical protein